MKPLLILFLLLTLISPVYAHKHRRNHVIRKTEINKHENISPIADNTKHKTLQESIYSLPWYGVFDWVTVEIDESDQHIAGKSDSQELEVHLKGYVLRPLTKIDAERVAKEYPNVKTVFDEIEVMPLSMLDDQIRLSFYQSLFSEYSPLLRYGVGTNPAIHIIVKHGTLILEGTVGNKSDASIVYIKARGVSGVFEVINHLQLRK